MPGKRPAGDGKRMQYTTVKVRLYPSEEQAEQMEKTFGCCRYLWNRMLSDAQEFYAATDLHYIPTPAHYKKEAPFLREVDSQPLCTVHQNLRQAYLDFFRSPAAFRHPQFKRKKARKDSFTVYCRQYRTGPSIRLAGEGIQMPKLGLVKARVYRRPLHWWSLRSVTVCRSRSGKYFCSIVFGYAERTPEPAPPAAALGLNYSPARFYVDSEGESPRLPALERSGEKLARMQRKLSCMERGSKNYEAQLQRIRLQHEHIANQRKDFIHKESRRIANAWDAVCVRETNLVELSGRAGQGGMMNAGFGMFRECLKYKLERQGKQYVAVDPYIPAAKTCHWCGGVNETLTGRERDWTCPHCGARVARAVNTARNLRDIGLARLQG